MIAFLLNLMAAKITATRLSQKILFKLVGIYGQNKQKKRTQIEERIFAARV